MLKKLQAMDCFIHLYRILKLQVIVTVTGQEAWKTEKSITGFVLFIGETTFTHQRNNLLLHYPHVKQNTLLLHCVCHAIWLRKLMEDLQQKHSKATRIFVDNKSTIALAKNPNSS